jgi:hypothetical protein
MGVSDAAHGDSGGVVTGEQPRFLIKGHRTVNPRCHRGGAHEQQCELVPDKLLHAAASMSCRGQSRCGARRSDEAGRASLAVTSLLWSGGGLGGAGPFVRPRPAYQAATQLAKELRGYAHRAGRLDGFDEWIRQVRADNARRRALQDEFTSAGLPR